MALFGLIGLAIGTIGTLVGAGGGFILVPLLVFLLPEAPADQVTAISMAVVFFNALSGTIAYAAMRRIDFASGWRFAVAALPGAFLGAVTTAHVSRGTFELILGVALILIAALLARKSFGRGGGGKVQLGDAHGAEPAFVLDARGRRLGALLSAAVGYVSSVLGIGGGIVHVPALVYILGFPVHVATATSHFVLACTSLVAVTEHAMHGSYQGHLERTAALAVGAVLGAQIGARLSRRVKGPTIVRALAVALVLAGLRIVWRSVG